MDFDTAKENIEPLASGRNAEQLETALIAESDAEMQEKLLEQRKEFEKIIETYTGDDPLQPWYDYIVWIEQMYPKSGKESAWYELVAKCLSLFESDNRYFQDRRMVKLYIKYIDCEPNPPEYYEQLYNSGIGTMVADLYLCWAHYYDYCDNFEKAESVYRKGLDARAQPLNLIQEAHKQFGFSMSQRLLYKDEGVHREFRSSMEEKRLALTSLRAHKHRHVGSIRTGSAVRSHNPGRVSQASTSGLSENRQVQIYDEAQAAPMSPSHSVPSTSVVQTILNSTKKQENLREPGPWNKAKIKSKPLFTGAPSSSSSSSKLAFSILEDDDNDPIPLPDNENNFARGIQLPANFKSKNLPQDNEYVVPSHRDDEMKRSQIAKYNKFMVYPNNEISFSLEELQAYRWFKKQKIENQFTRTQAKYWENGYDASIRIPPGFKRNNKPQEDTTSEPFKYEIKPGTVFSYKINLIFTETEEYSPEEILQSKWINGELRSQKDAEMDLTIGYERNEDDYIANVKRRSMACGGRKSILPRTESPRTSLAPRKSLAPIVEAKAPSKPAATESIAIMEDDKEDAAGPSNTVKKISLTKRKSVYDPKTAAALETIPESFSPPVLRRKMDDEENVEEKPKPKPIPFAIFTDEDNKSEQNTFKIPQSIPPATKPAAFNFDDDDECNTQMFNFHIKSQQISTPKVNKVQSLLSKLDETESETMPRKELSFNGDSSMHEIDEEPAAAAAAATWKHPLALQTSDAADPQYTLNEPNEIYRQKLSAIMEMTEEMGTVSTVTASSKSSSAEDFDFTKNHQTTTNRSSAILMKTSNMSKMSNVSKVSEVPAIYERTLPPAAQFCIYEDEQELVNASKQSSREEKSTIVEKITEADSTLKNKCEISQSKSISIPSKSIIENEKQTDTTLNVSKKTVVEYKPLQKNASIIEPETINKSLFKMPKEDTVPTAFVMNFNEEKTEKIPDKFDTTEMSYRPPVMDELPSIHLSKMPGDDTMLKMFNASGFELPKDDTVSAMFKTLNKADTDDKTTNFSIFQPMTMGKTTTDLDVFKADTDDKTTNFSIFQPMAMDKTTTDLDVFKMNISTKNQLQFAKPIDINVTQTDPVEKIDKPAFEIYQDDTGLVLSKGQIKEIQPIKEAANEGEEKENFKPSKSMYGTINQSKTHEEVDDELWAMVNSSKTKMSTSIAANKSKLSDIDELYAMLNNSPVISIIKPKEMELDNIDVSKLQKQPVEATTNLTLPTEKSASTSFNPGKSDMRSKSLAPKMSLKPATNIDDELYAMITPNTSLVQEPSIVVAEIIPQIHQSNVDIPSQTLLEPMKDMSIHDYQKRPSINMSNETGFALSEEIPNTAMFSLNVQAIKNSTIIASTIPTMANELKMDSVHIKEESMTAYGSGYGSFNLSGIELTEAEKSALYGKNKSKSDTNPTSNSLSNVTKPASIAEVDEPASKAFPQFMISAPVSIRPSQFQMNATTLTETFDQTEMQQNQMSNASKMPRPSLFNKRPRESRYDASIVIVEDADELPAQNQMRGRNSSRKESMLNHFETNPKLNETLGALKHEIDPFDSHLQNAFLDDIDFHEYISNMNNVLITTRVKAIEVDTLLVFQDKTFNILNQIGKGSFGFVYSGQCENTGKMYALKQERPANYWEFYISLEIASRVEDPNMLAGYLSIDYAIIGTNSSIFISDYCQYGSLFDVCNKHKQNTCRNMDEMVTMILSDQMLSILDHLHASNIIHGDIKPDNFLLMKKLSFGKNELAIKLIDFGRSIDLNFLPPNQTFTTMINTKNFVCTEMMEGRPWKYQIDLFCMAATIYTLLCGKYMNVKKQPESALRPYVLSEKLPTYLDCQLWENVLYPMINVRDCNATPDLQKLRLQIREVIASKERFVQEKINKFNDILDA